MTDASNLRHLRYGAHTGATEWTTTPTMSTFLEPENAPQFDVRPRHINRDGVQRGNGQRVPRLTMGKETSGVVPDTEFALRGLSGTDANSSGRTHDLDVFLTGTFGVETDGLGDTLSGTPGAGTTLLADGATSQTPGQGVLLVGGTDGLLVARQVVSVSGSNIVIDRDLTTSTGVSQDPANSSAVVGMRTYALSSLLTGRTHWAFDAEGDNWRNQFTGILSNGTLRFPFGGIPTFMLSGQMCTDHTDDDELALSNPTFSEPTRGSIISTIDAQCHIGSTAYMLAGDSVEIDLGLQIAPRGSNGPQGPWGFAVAAVNPVVRFSLSAGTGTAPTETTDALMATLRNDTPKDVSFQFGRTVGAVCYVRIPAMDIVAERSVQDGLDVITCVGHPRDASSVFAAYPHTLSVSFG
jgi:hypothetical protein